MFVYLERDCLNATANRIDSVTSSCCDFHTENFLVDDKLSTFGDRISSSQTHQIEKISTTLLFASIENPNATSSSKRRFQNELLKQQR